MSPHSPRLLRFATVLVLLVAGVGTASAQLNNGFGGYRRGGGGGGFGRGGRISISNEQTAREVDTRSTPTPEWTNPVGFEKDVFTFARLRFRKGGSGGGDETTDLPDADLNLSYRLQQMTSLKVDPNGRLLWATDPELANYPFLFAAAPNAIYLDDNEAAALRKWLLNGGCMILTDYWGDPELAAAEATFRKVLPNLNWVELQLDHPLYKSVFEITDKGQVPNIDQGPALEFNPTGTTAEINHNHSGDISTVHHRAIFDEKGRLLVLGIHNSDHSDGWEREGESDYYFHRFSEAIAYPLAINAIVYMMTH